MDKGLILIAYGHDNYLRMATNLVNSLKVNAPDLKVCLLTDKQVEKGLFDKIVKISAKDFKISPLELKSKLNKYTPFKHTIYLDVDMIATMHRSITELFDMQGEFTIQNMGEAVQNHWADVELLKKTYKVEHLTAIFSECFVWKQGELADEIFKKWQSHFHTIKVEYKKFNGYVPDELPLMIALAELKIYPTKWIPIYWRGHGREFVNLSMSAISQRFLCYSIGGNQNDDKMKVQYDLLSKHFASVTGVKLPYYTFKSKKTWNNLRTSC